jgi:hypothetical protein
MTAGDRRSADSTLVLALAAGMKVQDAARTAGVGEATVYRRLREDAFRQQVRDARAEMLTRGLGRLSDATVGAVETLCQLLRAEVDQVKLGAAKAILDQVVKMREHMEIEERLAALEARTAALRRNSA